MPNNRSIDSTGLTIPIGPHWQGIAYQWSEKNGKTYKYSGTLEQSSQDIYLDAEVSIIAKKCAALLILRPIHTFIKTCYHLSLFGVGLEIWHTLKGKQTAAHCFKNSVKSVADIVRTPLYGIVLTVLAVVAVIIYPFASHQMYNLRKIMGKIELSLFWGNQHARGIPILAPCFQPIVNLKTIATHPRYEKRSDEDTLYQATATATQIALNNLARKRTLKIREKFKAF